MSWTRTNFAAYSVEFSPFRPDLLAVGSAKYYGIVGNGMTLLEKILDAESNVLTQFLFYDLPIIQKYLDTKRQQIL